MVVTIKHTCIQTTFQQKLCSNKDYKLWFVPKTFGFNLIYILKYQLLIFLNRFSMIPYTKTYLIKISCWFVDVMFYGCCSIYIYIHTHKDESLLKSKLFINTLVNFLNMCYIRMRHKKNKANIKFDGFIC